MTTSRLFAERPPTNPQPGSLEEYEQRRCAACGVKYPGFGFGPPLTRTGTTVWACFAHQEAVGRQFLSLLEPEAQQPRTSLL